MSQINLKYVEIKDLKEKNDQVEKHIKILHEKVANLWLEIKGARSISRIKTFYLGLIDNWDHQIQRLFIFYRIQDGCSSQGFT